MSVLRTRLAIMIWGWGRVELGVLGSDEAGGWFYSSGLGACGLFTVEGEREFSLVCLEEFVRSGRMFHES